MSRSQPPNALPNQPVRSFRSSSLFFSIATLLLFFGISSLQFHSVLFEFNGFRGNLFTLLLVTGNISALFAPFIAGGLTKMLGRPYIPIILLLAISGSTLPFLPFVKSYGLLLSLYFCYTFCIWGIFPLYMACGMEVYRYQGRHHFFRVRSIGTLGFAIGCVVSAFFIDTINLTHLYTLFGLCLLVSIYFIYITPAFKNSRLQDNLPRSFPTNKQEWFQILPFFKDSAIKKSLPAFMLLGCANSMAIAVQSNFILHQEGGTKQIVSISWFLCSVFEIPVMFLCFFVMRRYGLINVLIIGFFFTVLRLVGMAYSPNLFWLLGTLTFHGFYYAGVITGLGLFVDKSKWPHRSAVQPMFALFYSGIPNITGAFIAGTLWKFFDLQAVFNSAALLSLISLLVFLPNLGSIKKRF